MLSWLKEDDQDIKIPSNARCLTKGIDVLALDVMIFFDDRDSIVNIVRALSISSLDPYLTLSFQMVSLGAKYSLKISKKSLFLATKLRTRR